MRIRGSLLGVVPDEAARVHLDLRIFEAQVPAVGTPSDRHQNAVEFLDAEFAGPLKRDLDLPVPFTERTDLRIQEDAIIEQLPQLLLERLDQIAIRARQE